MCMFHADMQIVIICVHFIRQIFIWLFAKFAIKVSKVIADIMS
jgi:hypothetical protein